MRRSRSAKRESDRSGSFRRDANPTEPRGAMTCVGYPSRTKRSAARSAPRVLVQCAQRVVRPHESVAGAGVNRERDCLAHLAQLRFERLSGRRWKMVIIFRHVTADAGRKFRPVRLHVSLGKAIERHNRLDPVRRFAAMMNESIPPIQIPRPRCHR